MEKLVIVSTLQLQQLSYVYVTSKKKPKAYVEGKTS